MMSNRVSIEREVAWGESREGAVAKRWLELSPLGKMAVRVVKSSDYDDFDFYVFSKNGVPLVWLETKVRTIKFGLYGDAMFPKRKHDYAVMMKTMYKIPVFAVTEYSCGALVQVDLTLPPAEIKNVTRKDRPGKAIPHVFYKDSQMLVLAKEF
jgi:hypothetical protein